MNIKATLTRPIDRETAFKYVRGGIVDNDVHFARRPKRPLKLEMLTERS